MSPEMQVITKLTFPIGWMNDPVVFEIVQSLGKKLWKKQPTRSKNARSIPVQVTYPDGRVVIYQSGHDAADALGYSDTKLFNRLYGIMEDEKGYKIEKVEDA